MQPPIPPRVQSIAFIGHGNPMLTLDESHPWVQAWMKIGERLSLHQPECILCISAHWETNGWMLTASDSPSLIYDFYGFPNELYQVRYPAAGSADWAHRLRQVFLAHQISVDLDPNRGWDHGNWCVLRHMFPNPKIPVLQLSINRNCTPTELLAFGRILGELRYRGVCLIGSGNLVHNLRMMRAGPVHEWAREFGDKVRSIVKAKDIASLANYYSFFKDSRLPVPTPEHFDPLLLLASASFDHETPTFWNDDFDLAAIDMLSVLWDGNSAT